MFYGEHFSRAAKACLYLVGNEQDAILFTKRFQSPQESWRCDHEATFTLYRLDYDSSNLVWGDIADKHALKFLDAGLRSLLWCHIHTIGIRKWCAIDLRCKRTEAVLIGID